MSAMVTMDELLSSSSIENLKAGEVVEGTVTAVKKNEVWIDLGAQGVGVVLRREIGHGQGLEVDQKITVSVIDPEMEEGYALLSMKRAVKDRGWDELQRIHDDNEIIEIMPYDANRGGLLVELEGIRGFLPVSQLAAGHYPRVSGADKDEILQKLHALVNKTLRVRVLDVSRLFSQRKKLSGMIHKLDSVNLMLATSLKAW
jgi:small subunit ribosomal protein S1